MLIRFTSFTRAQLKNVFMFSRRARNAQLILHPAQQIQNMIAKKQQKQIKSPSARPWKVGGEADTKYRVSLVGLPNCGKSSLFNCLIGQPLAVVDTHKGTTRDRKQYAVLQGLVSIIDTPGVEVDLLKKGASGKQTLKQQIFKQTLAAIYESNMIILVIDSKKPVTRDQIEFAQYLKAFGNHAKLSVVFNKCDGLFDEGDVYSEAAKLGLGEPWTASSHDGSGVLELLNFINDNVPEDMKNKLKEIRKQRLEKFDSIIKKLKKEVEVLKQKGIRITSKEWESDFRRVNPNPQLNESLDHEDCEQDLIRPQESFSNKKGAIAQNPKLKATIKICIIGRPNVGKSTLINQIIGEQRTIVSDVPHTTRDSIKSKMEYKGRKLELIDTAGINTPNIAENNEEYLRKVQISTMLHVKQSHVVVYLMDAFSSFVLDDFAFIRSAIKEGRPVIVAVNKWQAVKENFKYKAKNFLLKQIEKHLGELHGDPLVFVSARMGQGIPQMLDKILMTYDKWNTRVTTGMLNDWLQNFKKLQNLPRQHDHTLRINYLLQARVRPPHFIAFVSSRALFDTAYERFLLRNLAKEFGMNGIPLRVTLRSTNNRQNKRVVPRQRKKSKINQKMDELRSKYGNFGA